MIHSIMTTDSGDDVPALRSNASTPSEISSKFNSYSYYKGAAVLRMAEHILGREVFQEGINKYLTDKWVELVQPNKYETTKQTFSAYQPVEPSDLWEALEAVSENEVSTLPIDVTLSEVMENWIETSGYPVVNVTLNGSTIVLTQVPPLSHTLTQIN